jgi:hypothetical protein
MVTMLLNSLLMALFRVADAQSRRDPGELEMLAYMHGRYALPQATKIRSRS